MDAGFDSTIDALKTSMDLRLVNQNVISSNIANADTPEYKAQKLEFEQAFREALGTSDQMAPSREDERHLSLATAPGVLPGIVEDTTDVEKLDGNTVNRAKELVKLSENQLMHETSAELIRKKLGMLKYSITEGGGIK